MSVDLADGHDVETLGSESASSGLERCPIAALERDVDKFAGLLTARLCFFGLVVATLHFWMRLPG
jgi:hypothetical protein